MPSIAYLVFNVSIAVVVLITAWLGGKLNRQFFRGLFFGYVLVSLPFIIWDIWAAAEGHWGFNPSYVLSVRVLGLPVEEIAFFFVIPLAMMFVWEAIKQHVSDIKVSKTLPVIATIIIGFLGLVLALAHIDKGYTRSVGLVAMLTSIVLIRSPLLQYRRYAMFQTAHLVLFMACNSILTALPIITYGNGSYVGFRIGTIPFEDFLFSYALVSLFLVVYEKYREPMNSIESTPQSAE